MVSAFGHDGDSQWLEEAQPLHNGDSLEGTMVIVADAGYIRSEGIAVWQRSFLRILALVVFIVVVTLAMVSWFLLRPMTQVAERMRRLRLLAGQSGESGEAGGAKLKLSDLKLFSPLVREVETMAESLMAARAAAATEARLRDAGEHLWTAERLAVHMRDRSGSSRIFVVSNREPYMHVRQGRETVCIVPPSGLVTAIEPILRACDGVWVASGSGNADADDGGRFRPAARASGRSALYAAAGVAVGRGRVAILRRVCQRGAVAAVPHCAHAARSSALRTGSAISA